MAYRNYIVSRFAEMVKVPGIRKIVPGKLWAFLSDFHGHPDPTIYVQNEEISFKTKLLLNVNFHQFLFKTEKKCLGTRLPGSTISAALT